MWTAEEFANVLEENPKGGTFWTGSHRVVRYIRVCRPDKNSVVAIMTQLWKWKDKHSEEVELFVRTSAGDQVAEFFKAKQTPEFLESILNAPILSALDEKVIPEIKRFLSSPDDTYFYTW